MESKHILIAIALLLSALVVFQLFQINSIKKTITGNAVKATSGAIDMTGWTDQEKMTYDHHGTLPARYQGGNSQASSGMVGGC